MANTFKRLLASVSTSESTIYTVPAATTTVVIGFNVANKLGTMITVDVTAAGKQMGKTLPVPAGASLGMLDGKLVLEAADTITATADTTDSVDIILSVMEIS
jgi:hypothetical protein